MVTSLTQSILVSHDTGLAGLKYDAAESSPRRRPIVISSKSEDAELPSVKRQALSSQARDMQRNFTLAAFAIRKHLQYVSDFTFNSLTDDEDFNRRFEEKMRWWGRRKNCDYSQRHNLAELITMIESSRVIDGDIGIVKHASGRIQLIESDRIRSEAGSLDAAWVQGVKLGTCGQNVRYAISKRKLGGGFEFEREVSAANMLLCGYFTRVDQVRGVSPLSAAINQYADLYEGLEYALAKAKLAQLLGFVVHLEDERLEDDAVVDGVADRIKRKFGPGCLEMMLGMNEKAELFASNTPSNEFQTFCEAIIRSAFASLDLPYSFYDGSKTNFFGSKGELEQYIDGCEKKQVDLVEILTEITEWLLGLWLLDGSLALPKGVYRVEDVKFDWRGAGVPYWRLIDDSKGYVVAAAAGLGNVQDIANKHGSSFFENTDKNSESILYARDRGIRLPIDAGLPITRPDGTISTIDSAASTDTNLGL